MIAVTFRRDRTGTHVSQRKVMVKRVHEKKKADMQKCMKKSSIAWGEAPGGRFSTKNFSFRGETTTWGFPPRYARLFPYDPAILPISGLLLKSDKTLEVCGQATLFKICRQG